jgi:hypothetical protein
MGERYALLLLLLLLSTVFKTLNTIAVPHSTKSMGKTPLDRHLQSGRCKSHAAVATASCC